MTLRAGSKISVTTLLCAVLFLAWICHLGRSQMDQERKEDTSIAVCKDPIVNSSTPLPSGDVLNCTFLEFLTIGLGSCNGNVTLEADPVAAVHSESSVLIRLNSTDSDNSTISYNLCIFPPHLRHTELIGCAHNGTEVAIEVDWKWHGLTNISVFVYEQTFIGCARTSINVAKNSGLQLNVSLQNDPIAPSITPFPFPPNHVDPPVPADVDVLQSVYDGSGDGRHYLVGNITFICETNHTEENIYFKYNFGDDYNEPYTNAENITHIYVNPGVYNYTVDAIAITKQDSNAYHATHSGEISILVPVSGISMKVNEDNKFEVNIEANVKISALGSRPISACWYVTTPGSVAYHPVDPDPTDQPTPAPSHNFTCRVMNDVFLLEPMSFPTAGQYVFVAEFHNSASQAINTVSFEVVQVPSKAVVASTSTLIAILAILIAVVSLLMIVVGVYIPYRKYKNKFTETANFKFVDLSESTQWDRAKMKVRELADRMNRNRRSSKVGLVNEQNESSRLMHFPFQSLS